ncbi:MAG: DinB family protein [Actinomycetota bacterium]|nr:DinB family protein [Actinomycetota bacterium]MDQ2957780.1 DinB family protein [Actinomycetota bacterium]
MSPQTDDQIPSKRIDPPVVADEKTTLVAFVDYHRQTLLLKCAELTPQQLVSRPSPPSSLCLLGLIRHLTEVEFGWLHARFAGEPDREIYGPGDADLDVTEADEQSVVAAFALYTEYVAKSQQIVAEHDLDELTRDAHPRTGQHFSLRWVLQHLLEEYARHNGHADLLREALDGAVGE